MLLTTACPICRRPEGAPCPECVELLLPAPVPPPPAGLDALHAALVYEGAGRLLVRSVKYRGARAAVGWLAEAMVRRVPPGHGCDAVTWAPTSSSRRHDRGFDQSELLARAVARRLQLPVGATLRRRPGPPQTGLAAAGRAQVEFCSHRRVRHRRLLLVDDVATTGATLAAAARALRDGGAEAVVGCVAALTPPPGAQ